MYTKVLDAVSAVLRVLITVIFAILIVPVTMQILSRYTNLIPRYIWTEEIARFCFIWIIMLGAMIAVRDDSHFDVDLLPTPKTRGGHGWSRLVVHIGILFMSLCFIWYGWVFSEVGYIQTSEIAELPMLSIYIAWPVAGLIWTLYLIEKLLADVAEIRGPERNEPYIPRDPIEDAVHE